MNRNLEALSARTFDLLVIGGGIHGLAIACDGSQRGLSVALVERDDFGSGTSFNHLRTIHGGLRYLQTLDVRRARESVGERRALARIAPHMVRPLAFVVPLTRSLAKGTLAMRAGFMLDRIVAFDRNRGVPPSHRLPPGTVLSRREAIERLRGLAGRDITAAAVLNDYVTIESDRLTFAWAVAAAEHGAALANHVDAEALAIEGDRVVGARATDRLTGAPLDIRARVTVNATGRSIDRLLAALAASSRQPMLKAMNLVTARQAGPEAIAGRSPSGRYLFQVPWKGRALFGTWESPRECAPDALAVAEDEIAAFIAELNTAFPSLDLRREEVTLVHRGIVPAVALADGRVSLQGHERIQDHQRGDGRPVAGLLSIAGTKYTTARAVAERITNAVVGKLGRAAQPCRTATTPLPGGDIADVAAAIASAHRAHGDRLPTDTIPHLIAAYGSRYERVLGLAASRPELRDRVADDSPVIGAELVYAARDEMAVTLIDAVVRRTPLGVLGCPTAEAIDRAAALVGNALGWTSDRTRAEIEELRRFYGSVNALKT